MPSDAKQDGPPPSLEASRCYEHYTDKVILGRPTKAFTPSQQQNANALSTKAPTNNQQTETQID
jgi:hypothetical protein